MSNNIFINVGRLLLFRDSHGFPERCVSAYVTENTISRSHADLGKRIFAPISSVYARTYSLGR